MKILFNVTNHPSTCWTEDQKKGWDVIVDIPFPSVDPSIDEDELFSLANMLRVKILNAQIPSIPEDAEKFLCIQGDFSLCYMFVLNFYNELADKGFSFVVPTTKRIVIESNGTKISKFQFVMWRFVKKFLEV